MDGVAGGRRAGTPKRIVICLDGTWNKVEEPGKVTNVVKFAQSVRAEATDGTPQVVYYNSGVGTGGAIDRVLGGMFGVGVRSNVHRAYTFLLLNYVPGDEIYILGFSRGAFTARALAAIIGAVGILKREHFEQFDAAWNYYRVHPKKRSRARAGEVGAETEAGRITAADVEAARGADGTWFIGAKVKALGVWDTVGSYGVPSGLPISGWGTAFTARTLGFHDRQLGSHVEHAYHAIGIDEARGAFEPTLWLQPKGAPPRANVEQVWFAGVHSDIGGGYDVTGLSDLALIWMMDRLANVGLELDPAFVAEEYCPCPTCQLHRSDGRLWRLLSTYQRPLFEKRGKILENDIEQEVINEKLHWSVDERFLGKAPAPGAYRPKNVPANRAALPTCMPGPFELSVLGGTRPHRSLKGGQPLHGECWRHALPAGRPPMMARTAAPPPAPIPAPPLPPIP